jgi:hypothetical protein
MMEERRRGFGERIRLILLSRFDKKDCSTGQANGIKFLVIVFGLIPTEKNR